MNWLLGFAAWTVFAIASQGVPQAGKESKLLEFGDFELYVSSVTISRTPRTGRSL